MAQTQDTEALTLASAFHHLADVIAASPSIDLGRRYPEEPIDIIIPADTVEDVTAAAIANGTRIFRDGVRTYTDVLTGVIMLRFVYQPPRDTRFLVRPVDVTDELAGRDA